MEPAFENIQAKGATLPEQAAEQISKLIVEQHLTCEDKLPSEFELAEMLRRTSRIRVFKEAACGQRAI